MIRQNLLLLFILASLLLSACKGRHEPEQVAERFLSAYLDFRFDDVASIASPKVQEQMRWRASQLTQAEVELVSEQDGAQVTVEDTESFGDSCIVRLRATNAFVMDSIGQPGHIASVYYTLVLTRPDGRRWQVADIR